MRNRQEIEREVKDFVASESSTKREQLQITTRLGHDLRIDGDDAAELMEAFAKHFQVDISKFNFDLHFGPEGAFNPFLYLYLCAFEPQKLNVPITIEDLVEAALHHEWLKPQHPPL